MGWWATAWLEILMQLKKFSVFPGTKRNGFASFLILASMELWLISWKAFLMLMLLEKVTWRESLFLSLITSSSSHRSKSFLLSAKVRFVFNLTQTGRRGWGWKWSLWVRVSIPTIFRPKFETKIWEREKNPVRKKFSTKNFFSSFLRLRPIVRNLGVLVVVLAAVAGFSLRQRFEDGVHLLGDCHQAELELLPEMREQLMPSNLNGATRAWAPISNLHASSLSCHL